VGLFLTINERHDCCTYRRVLLICVSHVENATVESCHVVGCGQISYLEILYPVVGVETVLWQRLDTGKGNAIMTGCV
jgi:hypothetical protein